MITHTRYLEVRDLVHSFLNEYGLEVKLKSERYRFFGDTWTLRVEIFEHYQTRSVEEYKSVIIFQDERDSKWHYTLYFEKLNDATILNCCTDGLNKFFKRYKVTLIHEKFEEYN